MSDENRDQAASEFSAAEDWKERVKAENAEVERERHEASETETAAETTDRAAEVEASTGAESPVPQIDSSQLPTASLAELVTICSTQAMVGLGVLPVPGTEQPAVDLPLARHFIDLLDVLEQKTQGNLDRDEQALLDSTLHQLRMAYVDAGRAEE